MMLIFKITKVKFCMSLRILGVIFKFKFKLSYNYMKMISLQNVMEKIINEINTLFLLNIFKKSLCAQTFRVLM